MLSVFGPKVPYYILCRFFFHVHHHSSWMPKECYILLCYMWWKSLLHYGNVPTSGLEWIYSLTVKLPHILEKGMRRGKCILTGIKAKFQCRECRMRSFLIFFWFLQNLLKTSGEISLLSLASGYCSFKKLMLSLACKIFGSHWRFLLYSRSNEHGMQHDLLMGDIGIRPLCYLGFSSGMLLRQPGKVSATLVFLLKSVPEDWCRC